jgi:hypothetical protein
MGTSTDGQLCFGISFEEDFEFPWKTEEDNNDIDAWWLIVSGFKASFSPYDSSGNYKDSIIVGDPRINAYHTEVREWNEENPLPVELVYHCSYDYPMFILAVKGTMTSASRGYPCEINPDELKVSDEKIAELKGFCEKYNIETDDEPKWWLSSLWG